jgi:hypothetical protein
MRHIALAIFGSVALICAALMVSGDHLGMGAFFLLFACAAFLVS